MSSAAAEPHPHRQRPGHQAVADARGERKCYLLVSNPSKTTHLGTLLRCAAAFQVHQVLLVGYDKFNCQGSFGSHLYLDIVVFPSWDSVLEYLRCGGSEDDEQNCSNTVESGCNTNADGNHGVQISSSTTTEISADERIKRNPLSSIPIIGILGAYEGGEEIFSSDGMAVKYLDDGYASLLRPKGIETSQTPHCEENPSSCLSRRSFPISTRPFSSDVCFLLTKDKLGLPLSQARICSGFVHVPLLPFHEESPVSKLLPSQTQHADETSMDLSAPALPPTTAKQSSIGQKVTSSVTQSYLLDTATILSMVLHHFTAWACYKERTYAENQKFVKDVKSDARRRLCRVFGEKNGKRGEDEFDERSEMSRADQEALDATMMWGKSLDETKGSDY